MISSAAAAVVLIPDDGFIMSSRNPLLAALQSASPQSVAALSTKNARIVALETVALGVAQP